MLSGLAKNLVIKDITETGVTVGWYNGRFSSMAGTHHTGDQKTFHKSQQPTSKKIDTTSPATRKQVRSLIDAGYKARWGNFPGRRTPTMKWITENLTIAQAGVILRALGGGSKEEWEINLPARSFLGITDVDMDQLREQALGLIEQAINEQ